MAQQTRWLLGGVLLLSACYLFWFSHLKAFWVDESLTYFTVHHRTFLGLLRFQSSTPIVLEPPANDVLLWGVVQVLGYAKWAFRLPSILLFLILQFLLFRLAALLGGVRAGLVAAGLLLSTQFVTYGAEARPYALLTTLTVAALMLWYWAHSSRRFRGLSLIALIVTLVVAVTSQFYGSLIFLPVLIAELVWCWNQRRRPDPGILFSVALGMMAILLVIPFLHAVKPYAPPHVDRSLVGWAQFAATYEVTFRPEPVALQRLNINYSVFILSLIVLCAAASFPAAGEEAGSTELPLRRAIWAALLTLTLYPLPALLIAYRVTHVYSPRHAVQCVAGLVALLAVSLGRFLRRLHGPWLWAASAVLVFYVAHKCQSELRDQRIITHAVQVNYPISQPVKVWLQTHPASPLYLTIDECLLYPFYGDPAYAARIRCVGSLPLEAKYEEGNIVSSLTEEVMTKHTDLPYKGASYEQMVGSRSFVLVYTYQTWLAWIPSALAHDGARSVEIGTGLGGTFSLVSVPN